MKSREIADRVKIKLRESFVFELPKRNIVELFIIFIILLNILYGTSRKVMVILFLIWSILGLLGFFIPKNKFFHMFSLPDTEKKLGDNQPENFGIPISIKLSSKGGFIAGNEITLAIEILDLVDNKGNIVRNKSEFNELFEEFSIVYFNSIKLPVNEGKFIKKQPEAGGVFLELGNLKNKSKIIFNSPGEYYANVIYRFKGNEKLFVEILKNEKFVDSRINISPAENYISIKNYSIVYSLTVIMLLLALMQANII